MEILKNYLETMFRNLPDTPDARRAKDELWQMMEDKYTDLISEGKSENEAVGTVITEFGNLDEFADVLGIRSLVPVPGAASAGGEADFGGAEQQTFRALLSEEAESYLQAMTKVSMIRALGVALCIISVCGQTFFGEIGTTI